VIMDRRKESRVWEAQLTIQQLLFGRKSNIHWERIRSVPGYIERITSNWAMIVPGPRWYSLSFLVARSACAHARCANGPTPRVTFRRGLRSRGDPSPQSSTRTVGIGFRDARGQRPRMRRTPTPGRPLHGPPRTARPYGGRSRRGRVI
jgi:hypothetical protein